MSSLERWLNDIYISREEQKKVIQFEISLGTITRAHETHVYEHIRACTHTHTKYKRNLK